MRSLRHQFLFAGFALVAILAAGCGGSPSSPSTPSPGPSAGGGSPNSQADVTVTIVGMNGSNSFSPNPVTVRAGQTVAWRNGDSLTHTATANGGSFNTGNIAPGGVSAPIVMSAAGSFGYHCTPHPDMTGTLIVQ